MKKILILDDDLKILTIFKYVLTNYETLTVNTYFNAKELFDNNEFDLVITDVNLNDIYTGIDFVKYITQRMPEMPIIIMSGEDKDYVANEVCSKIHFIKKGFTFNSKELLEAIAQIFNNNQST